ncbi:hypothetical protein MRX96_013241 [Rhipicephalus microplus]
MLIRRVFFAQFFYASLGASICRAATVPDFPTPVSGIQYLPLEQHMDATVCVLTDCPIAPVDDGHGLSVKAPTPCTDNASLHRPSFGKFHSVTSPAAI